MAHCLAQHDGPRSHLQQLGLQYGRCPVFGNVRLSQRQHGAWPNRSVYLVFGEYRQKWNNDTTSVFEGICNNLTTNTAKQRRVTLESIIDGADMTILAVENVDANKYYDTGWAPIPKISWASRGAAHSSCRTRTREADRFYQPRLYLCSPLEQSLECVQRRNSPAATPRRLTKPSTRRFGNT